MNIIHLIKSDSFRYHGKIFFKASLSIDGFLSMFFHKLRSYFSKNNPLYLSSYLFVRYYGYKYGFQIFTNNIGKGFYVGHFGTVIVNGKATIGNNVIISHGVVIDQVSRAVIQGAPTIGNNVWICTNAIIVGNIKISDNVLVALRAYLHFDVPPYSVVKGNPGQIYKTKGVDGYICNPW